MARRQHWRTMARGVSRELRQRLRRSVVVTCTAGTYRGVLWSSDVVVVVLRNAEVHGPNGWDAVDGEVLLQWSSVEFVQFAEWSS